LLAVVSSLTLSPVLFVAKTLPNPSSATALGASNAAPGGSKLRPISHPSGDDPSVGGPNGVLTDASPYSPLALCDGLATIWYAAPSVVMGNPVVLLNSVEQAVKGLALSTHPARMLASVFSRLSPSQLTGGVPPAHDAALGRKLDGLPLTDKVLELMSARLAKPI